ncbi:MAG: hypothetical protein M5R42_08840 [Rhodocyclaceae bacterium]|nr:hypothetical protein [Rhodocyclaceae bacterium]
MLLEFGPHIQEMEAEWVLSARAWQAGSRALRPAALQRGPGTGLPEAIRCAQYDQSLPAACRRQGAPGADAGNILGSRHCRVSAESAAARGKLVFPAISACLIAPCCAIRSRSRRRTLVELTARQLFDAATRPTEDELYDISSAPRRTRAETRHWRPAPRRLYAGSEIRATDLASAAGLK